MPPYPAFIEVSMNTQSHVTTRNELREHFRQTGEWRGLAEAYFGVWLIFMKVTTRPGLKISDNTKAHRRETSRLRAGPTYANMAVRLLVSETTAGRHRLPQEGNYLLRAYRSQNECADGYNNLGINLILIGQWDRAQEAFERAFALLLKWMSAARSADDPGFVG